ncbi:MAG: hypothetical protein PHG48_04335 [Eubacteriales bacterium]|nr:hypothetical protein [Eubacteriales bacterium]
MKWLGKISSREKIYLCFGNHDYGAFMHREDSDSGKDKAAARAGACAGVCGGGSKASSGEASFDREAFDSFKKSVADTGVNLTDNITLEIKASTGAGTGAGSDAGPDAGSDSGIADSDIESANISADSSSDIDTAIVSSGITGNPHPCIFLTGLQDCRIRLNNENGECGDYRRKYRDYGKGNKSGSNNGDSCGKINIAISHNPDITESLPPSSFDLLLCGHYHGGQIWAPFNLEFRSLRNDILSRKGITRGLHRVNGINIYISRGLGNVLIPFRFMSRPEAAIIDLTGDTSKPAE